ncbi:peptidase M50B-like-domain-containing protein [Ganoderma leucocontextum]|nr:peptidase M50B-like-domain-containing protein [Ganoderma leucocontextum]
MSYPSYVPRPPLAPPAPHMSPIAPTHDQVPVLYVIVVYAVVIFAAWVMPGARILITPLKLFTIGWHELCHISMAVLTGGSVVKVSIDPDAGGATIVSGGHPPTILAAGYIGSTIFGGLFIMAGFDTLVSKIMSFVIGIGLVAPLALVRDKLTILLTVLYEGLLIGFWFIDHACVHLLDTFEIPESIGETDIFRQALRWYCLLIGVMNALYVVWDIADDKYFHKANDSDASQWAIMYPKTRAHLWAIAWIIFEIAVLIGFVFLGIVAFKRTPDEMSAEAAQFLPT